MIIKKGDPVEFTRYPVYNYSDGEGEFGIAVEDEKENGKVLVELADHSLYVAKYIHAASWGGWLPEELEPIWHKHNSDYDPMEEIYCEPWDVM